MKSICAHCGSPYEQTSTSAQCDDCKPKDDGTLDQYRGSRYERGYDSRWKRLSLRARRLQPFCSDCGTADDLTADHSVEAWERHAAGKPIRLQDIDVVCRQCNSDRGAARGANANDNHRAGRSGITFLD